LLRLGSNVTISAPCEQALRSSVRSQERLSEERGKRATEKRVSEVDKALKNVELLKEQLAEAEKRLADAKEKRAEGFGVMILKMGLGERTDQEMIGALESIRKATPEQWKKWGEDGARFPTGAYTRKRPKA
jgi:hypothetical protein